MDRETEIALVRRALAHIDARTTDADPAPTTLPTSTYGDRHEKEIERIFRATPQPIAHRSLLPNPGDFLANDETGVPLLLVHGDDGRIQAFLNVCRHRGTRVENLPCGNKRAFVCPYHSW